MQAISTILIIAALTGAAYCVWRLIRRQRGQGDPEGHPRIRRVVVPTVTAVLVGSALAPAEESSDTEPVGREQDADRERTERKRQEPEKAERERAERRRRAPQGKTARVTEVIDGDTIELEGVGRVRVIGVDTPERGEECFDEATDYLRGRVGGKTVRYRYQQERTDRYDRALLDLFRGGQLVNLDIAEAGWGEELTIAPNDRYAAGIRAAEQEARAEPRGRWAGCATEPKPQPEPSPPAQKEDDDSDGSGGGGAAPSGTCSEIGITDFPVPPGDPRDRDGDGIACES